MSARRAIAVAMGAAALTYFLDPREGAERRRRVRSWVAGNVQRAWDESRKLSQWTVERLRADEEASSLPPLPVRDGPDEDVPEWPVGAWVETQAPTFAASGGSAAASTPTEAETVVTVIREAPVTAVALAEPPEEDQRLPAPLPAWVSEPGEPEETLPGASQRRRRTGLIIAGALGAGLFATLAIGLGVWVLLDDDNGGSDTGGVALSEGSQALVQDQAEAISLLTKPDSVRLPVVGGKGRLVLVYSPKGEAVMIINELPKAPAGKAYEAWVIQGNMPKPAGLFSGGRGNTVVPLQLRVPKGAIVAVTLERQGGVKLPTGKPLFVAKRVT